LHTDELDVDLDLVSRLLAAQFPCWAALPLRQVISAAGQTTRWFDSATTWSFDSHAFTGRSTACTRSTNGCRGSPRYCRWPYPPAWAGSADQEYPWPWSVYRWLDGETPTVDHLSDPALLATDVAAFVAALRRIDPTGAPPAGRRQTAAMRDASARTAIDALRGRVDTDAVTDAWDQALRVPEWSNRRSGSMPTWRPGTCCSSMAGSAPS